MPTPLEKFVQASGIAYPKNSAKHTKVKCPAHADKEASLTVRELADQSIMLKCHAGCSSETILKAVGLSLRDLFPDRTSQYTSQKNDIHYPYYSMKGELLFRKIRKPNKKFFIEYTLDDGLTWLAGMHPLLANSNKPLYNMLQLASVRGTGTTVYICEGEKDVDALCSKGVIATCNFDGASKDKQAPKWHAEYSPMFVGNDVVIVADNDDPGRAHARNIAQLLKGHARTIRVVASAHGKDSYDHLTGGGTLDTFVHRPDLEPLIGLPYRQISQVVAEKIDWLIENRLPYGGTTFFAGEGDEGKSFAVLSIAAALSQGRDIPEIGLFCNGKARRILLLAQEDTAEQIIRPRFDMLGGDGDNLYHIESLFKLDEIGQCLFEDTIKHLGVELVIADPLSNYYPRGVSPNSGHDVRPIIMACNQIAYRTRTCILNIAHNNKNTEASMRHRLMGSADIRNSHRAGFVVAVDPEAPDVRYVFHDKANWSPSGKTPTLCYTLSKEKGFQWLGETDVKMSDIQAKVKAASPSSTAQNAAVAWLESKLSGGRIAYVADAISEAEAHGMEAAQLFRAAKRLGAVMEPDSNGRKVWYIETDLP